MSAWPAFPALDPPPAMDICEWAESAVTVTMSERPGRLRLDPYQRAPLRAMVDRDVPEVALMWSSQLGKTLIDTVLVGYTIAQRPQPMLVMFPSRPDLGKFVREKLNPLLVGVRDVNARVERNNRGSIRAEGFAFDGGYCTMTTPRAVSGKHGTSASLVLADEIDDYGPRFDLDPLRQRGVTYPHACAVFSSTPNRANAFLATETGDDGQEWERMVTLIQIEYEGGTQQWYYAVCPHCDTGQVLVWDRITDGRLPCEGCGALWSEDDRQAAVFRGDWIAQAPDAPYESYWMSQLYSVNVPLDRTVEMGRRYVKAELTNQILAWPYLDVEVEPLDPDRIVRSVPDWAPFIRTAGVDVQGDRIEWYIVDFDEDLARKHIVAHDRITRSPDNLAHWLRLRRDLDTYGWHRLTVDGSFEFDAVMAGLMYAWPEAWAGSNSPVEIVRGYGPSFDMPLRGAMSTTGYFRGAVDEGKRLVDIDLAGGYLTLAPDLPDYVEGQLTSERLIRQMGPSGHVRRSYQLQPGQRNEARDCVVYAYMGAVGVYSSGSAAVSPTLTMRDPP